MAENLLKRASWLELLYDLAFVALVAQLTYLAADHHTTLTDALNIFFVGYTIFFAWLGTTVNRNLQEKETTLDKLFIQLQMIGAFGMSLSMPGVFQGEYIGYFVTLMLVGLVQVFMVLRMYHFNPDSAPRTKNIVQGLTIVALLWGISGFAPAPYHFVIMGMALALAIFTPLSKGQGNQVRLLNVSHIQERLGLFLILVLGEAMLVVALANTATDIELAQPFIVLSGVLIVLSLWWLYFEHLERFGEGVRPKNLQMYLHSHGFLFGSIILMAAAYKNILKHNIPTVPDMILLTLGLIGTTFTITVIRTSLHGWFWQRSLYAGLVIGVLVMVSCASVYTQNELFGVFINTGLVVAVAVFGTKKLMYYSEKFKKS